QTLGPTLDRLAQQNAAIDLAYVDGHHDSGALMHYLATIAPRLSSRSLVVLDDIYLYRDMWQAWRAIPSKFPIAVAINVGRFGLLIFGEGPTMHFDRLGIRAGGGSAVSGGSNLPCSRLRESAFWNRYFHFESQNGSSKSILSGLRNGASNRGKPLNRIRVLLDKIDQQRRLRVWLGAALFPVLERADICSEINGEERAGKIETLAQADEFLRRDLWCWLVRHGVRAERTLAGACFCEGGHAFGQLLEEVAPFWFFLKDALYVLSIRKLRIVS
ncbi:MAG: hypothetical protein QOE68_3015, partial [Thermoanaerobaculia bacterium]|nr:hypothetical protein [Thermoanaerobaculia bacterium]